jgi:hypothetical protein
MTPTLLIDRLEDLARTVRRLVLARGVTRTMLTAVLGLAAVVLVDWLLRLPPIPRLACLAGVAATTGVIAWRFVIRPLLKPVSTLDIARRAEAVFPQFQQRLVSALEFARTPPAGSQRMQSLVLHEAAGMARDADLGQVIDRKPIARTLLIACFVIGLLALTGLWIGPENRSIAAARLFDPFGSARWPSVYRLAPVGEVPTMLVDGSPHPLRVQLVRGDHPDAAVVLFTRIGDQPAKRTMLERVDLNATFAGQLLATLPSDQQRGRVSWWIEAGDDRLPTRTVDLVRPLEIVALEAVVTPPAYLAEGTSTPVDLLRDRVRAFKGSTLSLRARFNKPLASSEPPTLVGPDPSIPLDIVGEQAASVRLPLQQSLTFAMDVRDIDGLAPSKAGPFEIDVRTDQPPGVSIEQPTTGERRTPQAELRVVMALLDDAGIADLTLELRKPGQSSQPLTIPVVQGGELQLSSTGGTWTRLPAADESLRYRGTLTLQLDQLTGLTLAPGDRLELIAVARDNFELEGVRHEPVRSRPVIVQILSQDELSRDAARQLRDVASRLERTRSQVDRTAEETKIASQTARSRGGLDDADRAVASRLRQETASSATQTRQAADLARQTARELAENRSPETELAALASEVAQRLDRTADGALARAREQLGSATESDADAGSLDRAATSQEDASSQLAAAISRLGEVGTLRQSLDALEALLAEQRRLAQAAAEALAGEAGKPSSRLNQATREQLDAIAREQEALAQAVDQQLDRMEQTADEMARSEPELAQAMQEAARSGRASRISESQRTASRELRNNRQQSTRQAQQQAELGLQTLTERLNQARNRQLAALSRRLREAADQLSALVARQASHNLDAIGLLNRAVDATLREQLSQLASRQADAPLDSDPQRLTTAQTLSERNTRSLARTVSQSREGDQLASRLSRAASHMERALLALRDQRLPDAYEPAMVEALSALRDGLAAIERQQREVDQQLADAEQESLRAGFAAVLERQKRLAAETSAIDRLRDDAGRLDRASSLRLTRLPAEQGQTRDATSALRAKLDDMGSVAFTWITDRVLESMRSIRSDLDESKTGVPTQQMHNRVLSDLQRVVDSLAVKPREDRFEQANSSGSQSGGGQQQQQPLPSEAELRLLRGLQDDIAQGTVQVNDQPAADRSINQLVQLGGEQRSLRELLDRLLRQAGQGAKGLPAETSDTDDDLIADLLGGDPGAEPDDRMLSRMTERLDRSGRKLADDHDPSEPTQAIHRLLLADFDELIDRARKRQSNNSSSSSSSSSSASTQQSSSQSGGSQAAGNESASGQSAPAAGSANPSGGNADGTLAGDQAIEQLASEWGRISPRLRAPVLESRDDQIIERYRRLVEDYTRAVGTQAGED